MEVPKTIPDGGSPHLTTGSSVIHCLTDTLHEINCATPIERLCSTWLTKELSGKFTTQVIDQFNAEMGRYHYFLNEMCGYKQIFVLQHIMEFHNKRSMTGYKRTYGLLWDIWRKMT